MPDEVECSPQVAEIQATIANLSLKHATTHANKKSTGKNLANKSAIIDGVLTSLLNKVLPSSHVPTERDAKGDCDTYLGVRPDAAELSEKLSHLDDESSTLIIQKAPSRHLTGQDTGKTRGASRGNDSGYGSTVSTPESIKHIFSTKGSQAPQLNFFDRPIPEDLKDRFHDFKIQYTRSLWDAVSKGKKSASLGDISMKLRYRGSSEDTAQLYIIVQCDKRAAKRIKTFFAQQHIVRDLKPDFAVDVLATPVIRLSADGSVQVLASSEERSTFCGMPVNMTLDGTSSLATCGGLVMTSSGSKRVLYGMTASHPLAALCPDMSDDEQFSDSEGDYSDHDSLDDEDSDVTSEPDDEAASRSGYPVHSAKSPIGTVAYDSLSCPSTSGNHDWALIDLDCEVYLPNLFSSESKHSGVLVESEPLAASNHRNQRPALADIELFSTSNQPRFTRKQKVAVLTSRGIQRGSLSANDSSLMMAPGNMFVKALDLLPSQDSDLRLGDSGSWVVDETTHEVYGHVISVDCFGEAYVIPIQSTLHDIQTQLCVDNVSLPITGDQHRLLSDISSHLTSPIRSQRTPNRVLTDAPKRDKNASYIAPIQAETLGSSIIIQPFIKSSHDEKERYPSQQSQDKSEEVLRTPSPRNTSEHGSSTSLTRPQTPMDVYLQSRMSNDGFTVSSENSGAESSIELPNQSLARGTEITSTPAFGISSWIPSTQALAKKPEINRSDERKTLFSRLKEALSRKKKGSRGENDSHKRKTLKRRAHLRGKPKQEDDFNMTHMVPSLDPRVRSWAEIQC